MFGHGRIAPVAGRVCVNKSMVDVTDVPDVQGDDEVVLLRSQDDAEVSAEELVELRETINCEFLARISLDIPRVVVEKNGQQ